MEGRYCLKELIATHQPTRTFIYKAESISGKKLCLKKQVFTSIEERNEAYLNQSLQKVLDHPNILRVHKTFVGEDEGHYLVTELEWGGNDLEQLTHKKTRKGEVWTTDLLLDFLLSTTSALAYSQEMGICHRDIKPMNIFYTDTHIFKIGDFGSAKSAENRSESHTIAGTPMFLSPELRYVHARHFIGEGGEDVIHDPFKSDVYSLGLTFVYLAKSYACDQFGKQEKVMKVVQELDIHSKLKETLSLMLAESETQRPNFVELESIVKETFNTVMIDTATNLIASDNHENWKIAIEKLISVTSPIKVTANKPEMIPEAFVEPQKSDDSVGPKPRPRLIKVVKPTITPVIDPVSESKECFVCAQPFQFDSTAPWRSRQNSEILNSICSEKCFNVQNYGELHPVAHKTDQFNSGLPLQCFQCGRKNDQFLFMNCRKHIICLNHYYSKESNGPWLFLSCPICPKPRIEEVWYHSKPFTKNDIDKGIVFIPFICLLGPLQITNYCPMLESHARFFDTAKCHICSGTLTNECCFFPHNNGPAFLCSPQCLHQAFPQRSSKLRCPTCERAVPAELIEILYDQQIKSFLYCDKNNCRICKVNTSATWFSCGHGSCDQCFKDMWVPCEGEHFPCNVCGVAVEKQQCGDLLVRLDLL